MARKRQFKSYLLFTERFILNFIASLERSKSLTASCFYEKKERGRANYFFWWHIFSKLVF